MRNRPMGYAAYANVQSQRFKRSVLNIVLSLTQVQNTKTLCKSRAADPMGEITIQI